jgi:hypothetical protein
MTKISPMTAAQQLRRFIDGKTCRRLPAVALQEALKAVMAGADPRGVAEAMKEAA